jgi:hypothetical protein
MAANYNDTYSGIEKGKLIRAQDVVDALNSKEKVAYKVSAAEWAANKTSGEKYPSCAAADKALTDMKSAIDTKVSGLETAQKNVGFDMVTSITSSSGSQVPTAKAVWDLFQSL